MFQSTSYHHQGTIQSSIA